MQPDRHLYVRSHITMIIEVRTWMTLDLALLIASAFSLLERLRKFSNSALSRRNLSCTRQHTFWLHAVTCRCHTAAAP